MVRWANILIAIAPTSSPRRRPDLVKRLIRKGVGAQLPDAVDVDVHFKPRYNPWDQRLCIVPDGDLFRALRRGEASIVTDTIETFTPTGIRLTSGAELEADVIVTATGLQVLAFGGIELVVDGEPVDLAETMAYKALMLSGVPNFVYTVGYTNASWTLKADLVSTYVVRLLRHLDRIGARSVVPVREPDVGGAAVHGLHVRLRAARARPAAAAGRPGAVAAQAELPHRPADDPARPDRRRRARLRPGRPPGRRVAALTDV